MKTNSGDSFQCTHITKDGGFCIECGSGRDEEILLHNTFINKNMQKNSNNIRKLEHRHKEEIKREKINQLLTNFELQRFREYIYNLLATKQFKTKLSLAQKVAVSVFYLSRKESIFVEIEKIVRLFGKDYKSLLKAVVDNFEYVKNDDEMVLYEFYLLFKHNGYFLDYKKCLDKFKEFVENRPCTNKIKLAVASLLSVCENVHAYKKLDLKKYVSMESIKKYNEEKEKVKNKNRKRGSKLDELFLKINKFDS